MAPCIGLQGAVAQYAAGLQGAVAQYAAGLQGAMAQYAADQTRNTRKNPFSSRSKH